LKGTWGVANVVEQRPTFGSGGTDTIDLSDSSQNYVHILSNGNLFSAPDPCTRARSPIPRGR